MLLRVFVAGLLLGVLCTGAAPVPAQETAPEAAAVPTGETIEETDVPEIPSAVVDPAIPEEHLALRLIPLTKDQLVAAADQWRVLAQTAAQRVADAKISAIASEGPAAEQVRSRLPNLIETSAQRFDKLTLVVDALEEKGADPALVAEYRDYRRAVMLEGVRATTWRTFFEGIAEWFLSPDGGLGLLISGAIVVAAFLALLTVAQIVRGGVSRRIHRIPNISRLLQSFLVLLAYWLTIAVGLMVVLSVLGLDITPLFAVLGGASFILAFALQETLGNLAAGLMIMTSRPFDEGDYVDLGGISGTVTRVSIHRTTLVTPDNQLVQVPNSRAWGNVITNVTASETRRVDLVFSISYGDDLQAVQRALEETVSAHPLVLEEPPPTIKVDSLSPDSIDFICRPWTRTSDLWTVRWDLLRQVKERFDRDGITIPFPQRDVHLHEAGQAAQRILSEKE